jgi:heme/copper-type cytochrome/quinol oxidase subunit 2
MKHRFTALVTSLGTAVALLPGKVLATDNPFNTAANLAQNTAGSAGITSTRTLPEIIGLLINVVLGFLGIVFLVLLLYAGFLWMTAAGDEQKVKKARDMIFQAVIGLVIVVAAFAISSFVLGSLVNVTGQ